MKREGKKGKIRFWLSSFCSTTPFLSESYWRRRLGRVAWWWWWSETQKRGEKNASGIWNFRVKNIWRLCQLIRHNDERTTARHPEQSYFLMTHTVARGTGGEVNGTKFFTQNNFLQLFCSHSSDNGSRPPSENFVPSPPEWRVEFSHFHHRSAININDNDISRVRRCASWPEPGTKRWLVRILSVWARQSLKKFQHFIVRGTLKCENYRWTDFNCDCDCDRLDAVATATARPHGHHPSGGKTRALKIQEFAMTSQEYLFDFSGNWICDKMRIICA